MRQVFALVLICCLLAASSSALDGKGSHWRFEEPSGTAVLDSGTDGIDGTLNPLPSRVAGVASNPVPQTGFVNGQALGLNWASASSGGFVVVPDTLGTLSSGGTSFTIEAWVKLDQLSNTSGANQRQYLCQKKESMAADDFLDYALLVQSGNLGGTGRELAFRYGTGSAPVLVLSSLELTDLDWHFVSLAYDAETGQLRFGLDGAFDTHSHPLSSVANTGALRLGAHQNTAGANNHFLRGSIDEVRFTPSCLTTTQLLDATALDCNSNLTPDYVDVLTGTSLDCNGNWVPDDCDLSSGASQDCNSDGIPDECNVIDVRYDWTDGEQDGAVASDGAYTGWLDAHRVSEGMGTLTHIDAWLRMETNGKNIGLYIWSDPNQDGDPTDAQVLSSISLLVDPSQVDRWNRFDIPDVTVGSDGTSFFVGALMEDPDGFVAPMDIDPPSASGTSWLVGWNSPIDPNDLTSLAVEFGPIETLIPFPANWLIAAVIPSTELDCNLNGIPDICDITGGSSADSNSNQVPDECEFPGVYFVPDNFGTIQNAIDVASNGSEIVVRAGTYLENLDFNAKELHLRSESGPGATTIDGSLGDSTIRCSMGEGPGTIIEGFTITGATNSGIFCFGTSPTILGNIVTGNSGSFGGGILCDSNASPLIEGNTISGNHGVNGGGGILVFGNDAFAVIRGNLIEENTSDSNGGGIDLFNCAATAIDNVIRNNSSANSGGGVMVQFTGTTPVQVLGNRIENNHANDDGGGIWFDSNNVVVANNLLTENTSPYGAGVYSRGNSSFVNNTVIANTATIAGGGLYQDLNDLMVAANNILRGNSAPNDPQLFINQSSLAFVTYSNIEGGFSGAGNIDLDPRFRSASDYRLSGSSPCIDAGDSSAVPAGAVLDLAGRQRFLDAPAVTDTGIGPAPVVDMGALEFAPRRVQSGPPSSTVTRQL